MLIEGAISVKAAVLANKRKIDVVYIDKDKRTKDFSFIINVLKKNNIDYKLIKREEFAQLNVGKTFGGICALVEERINDSFDDSDIFYLDGIEDPFNLGYIIRTLYAFGIKNIILPLKDYTNIEGQLIKSSAGAFEYANIIFEEDVLHRILDLKKNGYTVYSLKRGDDAYDIFDEKFDKKCVFLLGGEKRGISSKLLELSDRFLFVPYGSNFRNSLSAVSCADVVATLIFGQRKND